MTVHPDMPQVYVITGSTRGIGFGLARELLSRGQRVVVNGRTKEKVDQAVSALRDAAPSEAADSCVGIAGDVRAKVDEQKLWDCAVDAFGRVDCWINNAAVSPDVDLAGVDPEAVAETLACNVAGVVYGTQIAIAGMKAQAEGGRIYFVEGLGTDGRQMGSHTAVYGSSKYCNAYLACAFEADLKDVKRVRIGRLQPGMVCACACACAYFRRCWS